MRISGHLYIISTSEGLEKRWLYDMKASEFRDSGDKMRYRGWEMKIRQMKYQLCLKELAYA